MVRRQLGRKLRDLRERAGKTVEDVVAAGIASGTTVWRIETGKTGTKVPVIRSLCWLYSVDADQTEALVTMSVSANGEGWWEEYGDLVVPDWFGLYVGLEAAADDIRVFAPEVVHGLLQTPAYAEAVFRGDSRLTDDVVSQRVTFRGERQQTVLGHVRHLKVVLGAGALALVVGSPETLAAQKQHLLELNSRPNVSLYVRPWEAGAYPMRGTYTLLDFDDPEDPSVAYVEFPMGSRYVEKSEYLQEYNTVFEASTASSVNIEDYL